MALVSIVLIIIRISLLFMMVNCIGFWKSPFQSPSADYTYFLFIFFTRTSMIIQNEINIIYILIILF